jgi:ABC-type branched-subunit amino acid transport system substrate-binding protein
MSDNANIANKSAARAGVDRRTVIAGGVGALAAPAVLRVIPANAQSKTIKIGHVSPKTGPLAGFGESDGFIIDQMNKILKPGLQSGGNTYQVQIISKDSQSSGTRAAEVAAELITRDKVDLIVASSAPDTTNPVADQAEVNEVPCVTPVAALFLRPQRRSQERLHLDLSFLLGPGGRDRFVFADLGRGADQQNHGRAVSQ